MRGKPITKAEMSAWLEKRYEIVSDEAEFADEEISSWESFKARHGGLMHERGMKDLKTAKANSRKALAGVKCLNILREALKKE